MREGNVDLILFGMLISIFFIGYFILEEDISLEFENSKKLNIATYEEVFLDDLVERFEKEYNIEIIFHYFNDEYTVLENIQSGDYNYDLILVSDGLIKELIDRNFLSKIDRGKIKSRNYLSNFFKNREYDPGLEYSFPFDWGTTGILYNKNYFSDEISVNIFWDEKNKEKVALIGDIEEIIFIASKKEGLKDLPKTYDETVRIKNLIDEQKKIVGKYLSLSEINNKSLNGELIAALQYSSDALTVISKNSSFEYTIPKEGGTIWLDLFAIPKNSKNKRGAHKFIDFFNYPEINKLNFDNIYSFSTNTYTMENLENDSISFNYLDYSYFEDLNFFSEMTRPPIYYSLIDSIQKEIKLEEVKEIE